MNKTTFPVQDCFCLSCGSKMLVDDIDDFMYQYTDVYYLCPKCSMSLIRSENYKRVDLFWHNSDTGVEIKHVQTKKRSYK